jgi:hypothetical protein
MALTSQAPNSPGWYWVANYAAPTPTIVYVTTQGFGAATLTPALVVQNWSLDGTETWEGPIQPT